MGVGQSRVILQIISHITVIQFHDSPMNTLFFFLVQKKLIKSWYKRISEQLNVAGAVRCHKHGNMLINLGQ